MLHSFHYHSSTPLSLSLMAPIPFIIPSINPIHSIPPTRRPPSRGRNRRRRRRRNRHRHSPTRSRRRRMIIIRSTRFFRIIIRFTGFFGIRCGAWSGDVYGRRSSRRFGGCARAGCGHGGAAVSSADVFEVGVAEVERAAVGVVFGFFCEGVETHLFYFSFFFLGGVVVGGVVVVVFGYVYR